MVTALLADRAGARFKAHRSGSDVAEGRLAEVPVTLARPRSYMNLSGKPVAALTAFYKVPPDRLVVIHDELDIPFGTLRLKLGGGSGGHNGLRSITQALGTPDYYRVRFGIGRPPGRMDPAVYVLRDFPAAERHIRAALEHAPPDVRPELSDRLTAFLTRHPHRIRGGSEPAQP